MVNPPVRRDASSTVPTATSPVVSIEWIAEQVWIAARRRFVECLPSPANRNGEDMFKEHLAGLSETDRLAAWNAGLEALPAPSLRETPLADLTPFLKGRLQS